MVLAGGGPGAGGQSGVGVGLAAGLVEREALVVAAEVLEPGDGDVLGHGGPGRRW